VRRQYVGTGSAAERAALDAGRAAVVHLDAADAPLAALLEAADLVARAALTAGGFHQHNRGEWRRRGDVANG
jgi:hypothetical protein